MMDFTNDEMNLMCIYDTGSRTGLINALSEMRKELDADEVALRELTDSVLNKLSVMPDEDYEKLELYPDFDDEEDADAE
jgi:phytoene/squalene synthetase